MKTERDLTHVKQGDALAKLISVSPVSNATRAQAVHEMAISVHNLAVEEAARLAETLMVRRTTVNRDGSISGQERPATAAEAAHEIRAKLLRAP